MQWSWSIGRLFGIDTRIHATFALILVWAAFSSYSSSGTIVAAGVGVAFLLAVFGSVLLHELGHALTARMFGVPTRQIILTPIGGMAEIEASDLRPREELFIALAGPAVSLLLGTILLFLAGLFGTFSPFGFVAGLAWANLAIGLFNLVPAFPMDGGRVLRAGLAMRMDYYRATGIAAKVGQYAAAGFAILGLFTNPMLLLIAGFVYVAARQEARRASLMTRLRRPQYTVPRQRVYNVVDQQWPPRHGYHTGRHDDREKVIVYNEFNRRQRPQVRYLVTHRR